jgi:spore germination cell wall hydrolase CwlJ-like protein
MTNRSFEAVRRADHVLFGALALFIATVSAAAGAAAAYNPYTDQPAKIVVAPAVARPAVVAAAQPAAPAGTVVIDASNVRRASVSVADDSAMGTLLREHRCLADALYFEARGEGKQGEMAVAEVIFHRLKRGNFGSSICNVVYAGAGRKGCQFSFACNGQLRRPRVPAAWQKAQYLAAMILVGQARMTNMTGGAVNFHAASVNPDWAVDMERTTQIGNHVFYRFAPRTRPL